MSADPDDYFVAHVAGCQACRDLRPFLAYCKIGRALLEDLGRALVGEPEKRHPPSRSSEGLMHGIPGDWTDENGRSGRF